MDRDVILIIIGSFIGFIASIGTTLVNELINHKGKTRVFYKIVHSLSFGGSKWGFANADSGMVFHIPIWLEVHNTSNTTRIMRDVNISLKHDGKEVAIMVQNTHIDMRKNGEEKERNMYGDDGAYSFSIEPRSIRRFRLNFLLRKPNIISDNNFNEVYLRYYNERDKIQSFLLKKVDRCWELGEIESSEEWMALK